jgi:hypothetical protein
MVVRVHEGPPKGFHFPPEKFKSEMGTAGYRLAAQPLDFLARRLFLVFEIANQVSQ